ncbi:PKD domain-containing protein [Pseudoalteromonas byunsanensis]|uniref:Cadherin domain-containing protein n=1 Tax=Pseudoalteromonas byunsanensis TaxID=327939 RepID=A0A1S1NDV1_9GAMM|nr:PKD domain-containing protein [Pseudoalteromonas byunsanensis]OHU96914.1 hypothetical protein BIW53_03400 [Pseudoalteromonas byunsanensis]
MRNLTYLSLALLTTLTTACGGSGSKSVEVVESVEQQKPVNTATPAPAPVLKANALVSGTSAIGETIILDGINSQTYDGVTAKWQWLQKPDNSQAQIFNANTLRAQFIVDSAGDYRAQLTLTDLQKKTSSAEVLVSIDEPSTNQLPQASFNLSHPSILINNTLELDGTASTDADGDTLTYLWQISSAPQGAEFSLQNSTLSKASFTAQTAGVYTIALTVNDGQSEHSVSRELQVVENNHTPTLLRLEQTASEAFLHDSVYFTAYAEDLDSDRLYYQWRIVSRPSNSQASIQNEYNKQVYMTFDVIGEYVLEVVVSDGLSQSDAKRAHVNVSTRPTNSNNRAPYFSQMIQISANPTVGAPITLTTRAMDPDGDTVSYRWVMHNPVQGSNYTFSNTTEAAVELTVNTVGWYVVYVYANDGQVETTVPSATIVRVQ